MNELLANYFDTASATPVDARVIEAMLPYMHTHFGNPNSEHTQGIYAANAIRQSTQLVADHLGLDPSGIIWTSGATESITTALISATHYYQTDERQSILTTPLEHSALMHAIDQMNAPVKHLSCASNGLINQHDIEKEINAYLLATHHINNEIGVIQPIDDLIEAAHSKGILTCFDATQSLGKVSFDSMPSQADYLILSAHKAFGPRGIGILYANPQPKRHVKPIVFGKSKWHQRPGTLSTALIVGFAKALEIFNESSIDKVHKLAKCFWDNVHPDIKPNIKHDNKIPHIHSLHVKGVLAPTLIEKLNGFNLATGSACQSENFSVSHVLDALDLDEAGARESLRVSFCHHHTESDVLKFSEALNKAYVHLKAFNPI